MVRESKLVPLIVLCVVFISSIACFSLSHNKSRYIREENLSDLLAEGLSLDIPEDAVKLTDPNDELPLPPISDNDMNVDEKDHLLSILDTPNLEPRITTATTTTAQTTEHITISTTTAATVTSTTSTRARSTTLDLFLSFLRSLASLVGQVFTYFRQVIESWLNSDNPPARSLNQAEVTTTTLPDSFLGQDSGTDSACSKTTLLVVYKYPTDIVNDESSMERFASLDSTNMKTLKPVESMVKKKTLRLFPWGSFRSPLQRLLIYLLRAASTTNLSRLRSALLNPRTTNTPLSLDDALQGFGVSLSSSNSSTVLEEHDLLIDENDGKTIQEIQLLQRGTVILRLMSFVAEMKELDNNNESFFAARNLMEIEETIKSYGNPIGEEKHSFAGSRNAEFTATEAAMLKTELSDKTTTTTITTLVHKEKQSSSRTHQQSAKELETSTVLPSQNSSTKSEQVKTSARIPDHHANNPCGVDDESALHTMYLSALHMESIVAPTKAHASVFKRLLMEDPNVADVFHDEVIDCSEYFNRTGNNNENKYNKSENLLTDTAEASLTDCEVENDEQEDQSPNAIEMPSDKFFNRQWSLTDPSVNNGGANVINAWQQLGQSVEPVVVALIDSGVDLNHRDLINQFWTNKNEICDNGIDDDNNGYVDDCIGWDFINNDPIPQDDAGHGTASAGIIAAIPDNGLGIAPVCWSCVIMNLKVLDGNIRGPVAGFVKAIDYAVKKGVKVSSNSYGIRGTSFAALEKAITRAQQAGMVFVAAAGNFGSNNEISSQKIVPASFDLDNIISVASVMKDGSLSSFSNWGKTVVDIGAPGEDVLAPTIGGGYQLVSGTSFAVPHITGLVAAVWSRYPSLPYKEVIQSVLDGARRIESHQGKTVTQGTMDATRTFAILSTKTVTKKTEIQTVCSAGMTLGKNNSCVDIDECSFRASLCPSASKCVNFKGTFDCVCPFGSVWNGLEGSKALCRRLEFPYSGPCRSNGGCGINSLCEVAFPSNQLAITGRSSQVRCRCLNGYVLHETKAFCIRPGLESMNPDFYLNEIKR